MFRLRPAIRTHIPWEIAAEAFGREGDAITGFYRFSGKDALRKRSGITALLKQHGIDSDLFAVFAVTDGDKKSVAHVYNVK